MRGVPRIPEPWEWVKTKRCTRCGEVKPWAQFSPAGYFEDGTVRWLQSACHACQAKTAGARVKEWRRRNLEQRRAWKRGWERERRKKLAARNKDTRWATLPKGPFVEWMEREAASMTALGLESGMEAFARAVGIDSRTLRRVRDEQENVSLGIVDRCCTARGVHISELYGDDYGMAA